MTKFHFNTVVERWSLYLDDIIFDRQGTSACLNLRQLDYDKQKQRPLTIHQNPQGDAEKPPPKSKWSIRNLDGFLYNSSRNTNNFMCLDTTIPKCDNSCQASALTLTTKD